MIDDIPPTVRYLLIDFVNPNIKSAQFFKCAHIDKIYVRIFIGVSAHTCINIFIYTV
jgi:hypothetical protein